MAIQPFKLIVRCRRRNKRRCPLTAQRGSPGKRRHPAFVRQNLNCCAEIQGAECRIGWDSHCRLTLQHFFIREAHCFIAENKRHHALLRRLKCPETLLELMVLCYRMLFVFSEALADTRSAQAARLGYSTPRLALRSLGSLTANLTIQIWQRASDLHVAAQARNNDGPLRFLPADFAQVGRDLSIAAVGAASLIVFSIASL